MPGCIANVFFHGMTCLFLLGSVTVFRSGAKAERPEGPKFTLPDKDWDTKVPPSKLPAHNWRKEVFCNIDVLDQTEFIERFMAEYFLRKPVIVRGWPAMDEYVKGLRDRTSRKVLLEKYGEVNMTLGTRWDHTNIGEGQRHMLLKDFIRSGMRDLYLKEHGEFLLGQTDIVKNWPTLPTLEKLGDKYDKKPDIKKDELGVYKRLSFSLGGMGQGYPFHWEGDYYHFQIHGRKRWGLYAPGNMTSTGFLVTESYVTWLQKRTAGAGFEPPTWECIQEEGDALYVPEGMWHANACIGDSVGVTHSSIQYTEGTTFHSYLQTHQTSDRNEALKLIKYALKIDSSNAQLWVARAYVYIAHGELENAKKSLYRAINLNPLSLQARVLIMSVLQQMDDKEGMTANVKEAMALDMQLKNTEDQPNVPTDSKHLEL